MVAIIFMDLHARDLSMNNQCRENKVRKKNSWEKLQSFEKLGIMNEFNECID